MSLHVPAGSPAAPFAAALAWLWRLGPVSGTPHPGAVGVGVAADAAELAAAVGARSLAGAVVLAGDPGPAHGPVPDRRAVAGVADLPGVGRIAGTFTLLGGGRPVVRSDLGVHAATSGEVLVLGAGPEAWGTLAMAWVADTLAGYLRERLARPPRALPPLGCLRLDDAPGTAELQLQGRAKDDRTQERQLGGLWGRLRRAGATLVVAVAARALRDGEPVPLDEVWPRATAALRAGVRAGTLEPACHGLLHLDEAAWREGRTEAREFARLDAAEAGRRLDLATRWMTGALGEPRSFVAPAWGYSAGTLEAARERGLRAWLPPEPAPLAEDGLLRETLAVGVPGLHRLDYRPLRRLAELGLPPTVVLHGRLIDNRPETLRAQRDLVTLARLALRRDVTRLAALEGIRWCGAAELAERLAAHGAAP